MCRKNHTLASTITSTGDKTITGCTAGCPIIIGYKMGGTASEGSRAFVSVKSGANIGIVSPTSWYWTLGTQNGGSMSFIVIPTATSVVLTIGKNNTQALGTVYVYKC